jgi:hypothetical protein
MENEAATTETKVTRPLLATHTSLQGKIQKQALRVV